MSEPIRLRPWARAADVWLVWRPSLDENEEDAREVESSDAETAAEDYAEWSDSNGDYAIVGGEEATIAVRRKGDPSAFVERFTVSGETVPQYTARTVLP